LGAERERCRDPTAVVEPSGGDDWHGAGDVDDGRHEHHRRHPTGVATSSVPWATSTSTPASTATFAASTSPTVCIQRMS
jgi:hypothetical protein